MSDKVDDIRGRLEGIVEELTELSFDALREAVEEGSGKRPASEKAYSQARRSVEKAARILENVPADDEA